MGLFLSPRDGKSAGSQQREVMKETDNTIILQSSSCSSTNAAVGNQTYLR